MIDLAERTPRSGSTESPGSPDGTGVQEFCAAVAQQNAGPYRLKFYATTHAVVCVVDDAEVKA